MKVTKKSIAVGMLAFGLVTTAGVGITAAAGSGEFNNGARGGGHAEVAVNLLGITTEEFKTRVQAGEKPHEMLEAAGFDRNDVRAVHEQQMQERIAQAVADGRITQAESDEKQAKHAEHKMTREAAHTAVENNDYAAWVSAVEGGPRADQVDATTFSKLVEAHNLRESGDHDGARVIMQDLGFKGGPGNHGGQHEGHNR